jgi:ABC-2 type transport system ATP-binding protein
MKGQKRILVGMSEQPIIQTRSLSKYYGSSLGIEDISVQVKPGEIFGFLGPNGAGKTTLIRVLLDLLRPSSGQALLFGLDSHQGSMQTHAQLGNLPGEFSYWEKMTGKQVLDLFANIRQVKDLSEAHRLAQRFQADLNRPLGQLSRGNRQKIGLVLAMFHRPKLLIMDEPTAGLDPLMQAEFMKVIQEYNQQGTTVFLSSHDLAEVERVCHRIGVIKQGKLIAVEEVEGMRERADHRVFLHLAHEVDTSSLQQLSGVHDWSQQSTIINFHLLGNPEPLIGLLQAYPILDIEITKPTLEEMFLQYYSGEAK